MLNLIFAKITKGNLKLIIIVIISSLLYVLICNGTKYKHKLNLYTKHNYNIQARQTRPNSGGVAEGHPRFDKGGVAIIFYLLRVKSRTF